MLSSGGRKKEKKENDAERCKMANIIGAGAAPDRSIDRSIWMGRSVKQTNKQTKECIKKDMAVCLHHPKLSWYDFVLLGGCGCVVLRLSHPVHENVFPTK